MLLLSPSTLVNIPCLYPGILTTFLSFYVKTFDSDMAPVGLYRKNEGKHHFFYNFFYLHHIVYVDPIGDMVK